MFILRDWWLVHFLVRSDVLALHVSTPTSSTLAARYLDGLGWRLLIDADL